MLIKLFLFFILISGIGSHAKAEDINERTYRNRIDSLLLSDNYPETSIILSELSEKLVKTNPDDEFTYEVLLSHAYILSLMNQLKEASEILLPLIEKSNSRNYHTIAYKANLVLATIYEIAEDFELCNKYLVDAFSIYNTNSLEREYSTYCVRRASYYRFTNNPDSAKYFILKAIDYAQKFNNYRDLSDGYFLMGVFQSKTDYKQSIQYFIKVADLSIRVKNYRYASWMYNNSARKFINANDLDSAFKYNTIALQIMNTSSDNPIPQVYNTRSHLFEIFNQSDSSLYYFKKFHIADSIESERQDKIEVKRLSKQFENEKKDVIIQSKSQQINFIIIISALIAISSILLYRKNKKIQRQNKLIKAQVGKLEQLLEQKKILLAEVQHRVKNNLQQITSILEIQKESISVHNIDEVIRENQNRIQSMALLHNKIISTDLNTINIGDYITELSNFVIDSYQTKGKQIHCNVESKVDKLSIETSLSIGLIIVELTSNSLKHAFKNKSTGNIYVNIYKEDDRYVLHYKDDGIGYRMHDVKSNGLGIEIISGLIHQIGGTAKPLSKNGFELTIHF